MKLKRLGLVLILFVSAGPTHRSKLAQLDRCERSIERTDRPVGH